MAWNNLISDPRITIRRPGTADPGSGCVVYWMQRAQRALDNPALDVAVAAANALHQPVVIFFAPVPFYPNANLRHYAFLAQGIPDIAERARQRGVGFVLRRYPDHSLARFCDEVKASLVIGDENPMREPNHWRESAAKKLTIPLWTVDADVIVPSKLLEKEQYAARVIRPRLRKQLERFLVPSSNPKAKIEWQKPRGLHALPDDGSFDITEDWKDLDSSVKPVGSFRGGTGEALKLLHDFVTHKLAHYTDRHGKPELDGTSRLSPYLHFGHIGPHTVALAVEHAKAPRAAKDDFLDQLVTWRELSINFVHFNPLYDSIESAPDWAHRTLGKHTADKRPVTYFRQQMEHAETHDDLWNAVAYADAPRRMDAQLHAHVLGQENSEWSPLAGESPIRQQSILTTSIFSTAVIPTVTPGSPGRSRVSLIGRGSTAPSSALFAICQATRPGRNSTPTDMSSRWPTWRAAADRHSQPCSTLF